MRCVRFAASIGDGGITANVRNRNRQLGERKTRDARFDQSLHKFNQGCYMKKILSGFIFLLSFAANAAGTYSASMGDVPDLTPQLRIDAPSHIKVNQPIPVVIAYRNFDLQPALRCNPAPTCTGSLPATVTMGAAGAAAQGHIHVYFQRLTGSAFPPAQAASFCIPSSVSSTGFNGTVSGNCPALTARGVYRVSAEFQSNSHISSLKASGSPQHAPTSDTVVVVGGWRR